MKAISLYLYSIIILVYFLGCSDTNSSEKIDQETSHISLQNEKKLEELKLEASRLRGGGSIKSVSLDSTTARINYVANFDEYKQLNPQSSLSEQDLKAYRESGSAIKKALVDGSVRIMKKLQYVNQVNIILPFQNNTYSISVSKEALEKFTAHDFETLIADWEKKFSDPYVYDQNGREKFFSKFGTIR